MFSDFLLILLGRFAPLSISAPPMLLHLLEIQGVKPDDLPYRCVQELTSPIVAQARKTTRANRHFGGEKRLHANVLILLENYAYDLSCILRGARPQSFDLFDPEFVKRTTEILARHDINLPLYAKCEADLLWELAQRNQEN